jgi:hypothetical protein
MVIFLGAVHAELTHMPEVKSELQGVFSGFGFATHASFSQTPSAQVLESRTQSALPVHATQRPPVMHFLP